jgi:hypothetical protein
MERHPFLNFVQPEPRLTTLSKDNVDIDITDRFRLQVLNFQTSLAADKSQLKETNVVIGKR